MIRKIFTTLFSSLVIFTSTISAQDVFVSMNVSDQMVAGTDVQVEIRVVKSSLEGFARFQQDLPLGITAKAGSTANADFNFEDQRINLIWLKLPVGEELKFTYTIKAHETVQGNFSLAGKFSYIYDDDRNEVTLPPQEMTITPSPNVDPTRIVDWLEK